MMIAGITPSIAQQETSVPAKTKAAKPVLIQTRFFGLNEGTVADLGFQPTQRSSTDFFEAWMLPPDQLKDINARMAKVNVVLLAAPRLTTTSGTPGEVSMGAIDAGKFKDGVIANIHPEVAENRILTVVELTKVHPDPAGQGALTNFALKAAFDIENGGGVLLHGKSLTTNMILLTATTHLGQRLEKVEQRKK
jgi:hypothetical protein